MARSPEADRAMDDLRRTWRQIGPAARAVMMLGLGVLGIALIVTAANLVNRKPEAQVAGERSAPAPNAEDATVSIDGPVTLALEKGRPDPAGNLRRIVGGELPALQIGYTWTGLMKETPIAGFKGPPGWTSHFVWLRRPWSHTTIDVFESQAQADAALAQVAGGPASLLLLENRDGKTLYASMDIDAPQGGETYPMRCAIRARDFACATIPVGVPAIVTVRLIIDTETGPSQAEIDAKAAEMKLAMGEETDEVMRSLAALGLDGTRAVAR
jgi:hypothetical protein